MILSILSLCELLFQLYKHFYKHIYKHFVLAAHCGTLLSIQLIEETF